MKTIIVGTDFTTSSVNACEYAAFLAQKLNSKLIIFNMFEAPIIHSNVGLYGISYSSQKTTSLKKVNKLVSKLKILFPKVKIEHFATFGSLKHELENFVAAHQVEAAVMGLEAKDRISKFIYGSHGVGLAGKIDCPVIIVPSKYKVHKLSRVLLTVDNNEKLVRSPLKNFERFVKKTNSKPSVLHVRTPNEVFDPKTNAVKLNGKNIPIEVIKAKSLTDGLKKNIAASSEDMVVILSKKHSVFYDFFVESNTKRVAFAAKVPVMAIHE